jgi:hypothetical protein
MAARLVAHCPADSAGLLRDVDARSKAALSRSSGLQARDDLPAQPVPVACSRSKSGPSGPDGHRQQSSHP